MDSSSVSAPSPSSSMPATGSSLLPVSGGGGEALAVVRAGKRRGKQPKQPRQILTEEQYQSTLSTIVQRDYYPALPSLHRDMAVLERRAVGDVAGAVAVRRAYRKVAMEEEKAAEAEDQEDDCARLAMASRGVDGGTTAGVAGVRKRPRPLERESVTGFHDRATSEDNEEFDRVTRREETERIGRVRAIYSAGLGKGGKAGEADTTSNESRSKILGAETPLLPASEQFDMPVTRVVDATKVDVTDRNPLFFVPEHYGKNGNDGINNRNTIKDVPKSDKSYLMLPPPPRPRGDDAETLSRAMVSKDETNTTEAQASSRLDLVEYNPKPRVSAEDVGIRAVPAINPAMTRFPHQGESRLPPASGRRHSEGIAAPFGRSDQSVSNTTSASDTDASTDLDATPMSIAGERAARANAVGKEREQFVAMTPIIVPRGGGTNDGALQDPTASPIITWGNVAGTPLVLAGQTTSTKPGPIAGPISNDDYDSASEPGSNAFFKLPAEDGIEATARLAETRLADRTRMYREARSSAQRGGPSGGMSSSRKRQSSSSILDRTQSLTPAAKALLERSTPKSSGILSSTSSVGRGVSARSGSALASALRQSYTPVSSSRSARGKSRKAASATPRRNHQASAPGSSATHANARNANLNEKGKRDGGSITDGLLRM